MRQRMVIFEIKECEVNCSAAFPFCKLARGACDGLLQPAYSSVSNSSVVERLINEQTIAFSGRSGRINVDIPRATDVYAVLTLRIVRVRWRVSPVSSQHHTGRDDADHFLRSARER